MKMKAVRFWAPNDIRYEEIDVPKLNEGEILVRVHAALTCGTDIKTYRRGHPVLIKTTPSGFGHEFSGVIVKKDEAVTQFEIGDRVVCANSAPCGECFYCKRGEYELCENLELLNGAYAQFIKIPKRIVEKNTLLLPRNLSFASAAFTEPLSNVIHGMAKTPIKQGDVVGVMGIGPIGLMFARLAKLQGAKVIALGRNPLKLKMAHEFAHADIVIDINKCPNPEEVIINNTNEKRGLDVAIECVGLPEMWEKMFSLVRKGGYVHFFGGCASGSSVNLDTRRLHYDEVKIISSFHHTPQYFREALDMIASGKIEVDKLITRHMDMKYAKRAIEMHRDGEAIKVLLEN